MKMKMILWLQTKVKNKDDEKEYLLKNITRRWNVGILEDASDEIKAAVLH